MLLQSCVAQPFHGHSIVPVTDTLNGIEIHYHVHIDMEWGKKNFECETRGILVQ